MGSWAITIHGHGIHDNGREEDVDAMLKAFCEQLRARGGHVLDSVQLTVGGTRRLADGRWHYA